MSQKEVDRLEVIMAKISKQILQSVIGTQCGEGTMAVRELILTPLICQNL